jgi:hypothetical protein
MLNIGGWTLQRSKTIINIRTQRKPLEHSNTETKRIPSEYLHKNNTDPTVHNITNFLGFNTRTGINTNAITKQAAAPKTQHPNTINLSH